MSYLEKQEKYREYLKKLEFARQQNDHSASIHHLNKKSDLLLDELRNRNDVRESNVLILLLAIPILAISLIAYWQTREWPRFITPLLLVIYLIVKRIKIRAANKKNMELRTNHMQTAKDKKYNYLLLKIEYLLNGIQIKLTRAKFLQIYYILFFPLFLLYLSEWIKGGWPFGNLWSSLAISFLVGGVVWIFYFNTEIKDLNQIKSHLISDIDCLQ